MNFQELWNKIREGTETLSDDKSSSAIRTGLGIRDDFWDDFLLVINNSDGLSELLDVPVTKISSWHDKIKENLEKVKHNDMNIKGRDTLIKTGLPE